MEMADFTQALEAAVASKANEFDSKRLPKMIDSYRLLHTCAKNLFELLVKRSLIKEDPYKLDKKITKVASPDTGAFNETETATIMGIRLSDYDSMLDYVCTYLPTTTDTMTEVQIKSLMALNACIDWENMSANTTQVNTRMVMQMITIARTGAEQMTQRLIIDSLNNAKRSITDINATLKDLVAFIHEKTKCDVRRLVMGNAQFDMNKASTGGEAERSEIKRLWAQCMGKLPYNNDLVMEIVREDHDPHSDKLHEAVLKSLQTSVVEKKVEKKKADPKQLLVDAAMILSASAPQLEQVLQKVSSNHDVLVANNTTIFAKLKTALRRAFGIPDPPEEYVLTITNPKTQGKTTRTLNYNEFFMALDKRMRVYALIGTRTSTQFARIAASPPSSLYGFVTKQVSEMQDVMILLAALDEYFKANTERTHKGVVKGLKIELATIGNCVIKAHGRCGDFAAAMEEEKEMRTLKANKNGAAQASNAAQGAVAQASAAASTGAVNGGNK